ncbi:DinB family protein [Desertivirga xinjiangensis]|uniref:DinB family protein n=1 Tax=Desertivirga xinjiangensis TaxID=539206 RepID=UPI00210DBC21|nr:DinB family protein [Pedobacter xinjiangensis]
MENTFDLNVLKFPIGPFVKKDSYSREEMASMLETIREAPKEYRTVATNLSFEDLTKTYRPDSWNVRQLIHHVADIQLLHFFRMKKALTEPDYNEVTLINLDAWVNTADGNSEHIDDSIMMLEALTKRYVLLIQSLKDSDLKIEYFHPVRKFTVNQAQAIAMSAWHLKHHLAHIKLAVN